MNIPGYRGWYKAGQLVPVGRQGPYSAGRDRDRRDPQAVDSASLPAGLLTFGQFPGCAGDFGIERASRVVGVGPIDGDQVSVVIAAPEKTTSL